MYRTNLRKVGGSVMLAVPPALLELLQLEAGATIGLTVEGDRLIVQREVKPRYTLDELLPQGPLSEEDRAAERATDRDWIDLAPAGREL